MSRFVKHRLVVWEDYDGDEGWIRPGMRKWITANAVITPSHDLVDHATCDLSLAGELRALGALAFRYRPMFTFSSAEEIIGYEISEAYHNAFVALESEYQCSSLVMPKLSLVQRNQLNEMRREASLQFTKWPKTYGETDFPSDMDDAAFSHFAYGFAWAQKRYRWPSIAEALIAASEKVCRAAWAAAVDDASARLTITLDTHNGSVEGLLHANGETERYSY